MMTDLTFSLADVHAITSQVVKTDERCPIHDEPLSSFKNIEPFCQICRKEQILQDSKNLGESAYKAHQLRITTKVLTLDSILYDETIENATFENFNYQPDSSEKAARGQAGRLAERYLNGEVFNSLFSGEPGSGKSHLAMAILKVLNSKCKEPVSCLFISFEEVLSLIRDSFNNSESKYTELNMVDLMGSVDYLVLDDVGSESGRLKKADNSQTYATDFTIKILKRTLERRQNKSTIVTTNLSRREMEILYDKRITSRIYRNITGNVIKFENIKDKRISG